jgi:hypothetical protein
VRWSKRGSAAEIQSDIHGTGLHRFGLNPSRFPSLKSVHLLLDGAAFLTGDLEVGEVRLPGADPRRCDGTRDAGERHCYA